MSNRSKSKRRRRNPRSRREHMGHDPNHQPHHVPDHPLIPSTEPQLITQQADLDAAVAHARESKIMAFDTEFIGEDTFYPILCLIQVATPDQLYLIDPKAELELNHFWELIADEDVCVVVHAGLQDLEPAVRAINKPPANIIDIQIASGFIGLGYPQSLLKLVQSMLNIKMKKSATLTDWNHRPLSNVQLDYAAADVRYLLAIEEIIRQGLIERDRLKVVQEEMQHLTTADHYDKVSPDQYRRLSGSHKLNSRSLEVLRRLYTWRSEMACQQNIPPRAYLKDAVLVQIAQKPIKSTSDLDRIRHLPTPVIQQQGNRIQQHWTDALKVAPEDLPLPPHAPLSAEQQTWCDGMIHLFNAYAISLGISPGLISSASDLRSFFMAARKNDQVNLDKQPMMQGWRKRLLGQKMIDFVYGRHNLSFEHHDKTLHSEFRHNASLES